MNVLLNLTKSLSFIKENDIYKFLLFILLIVPDDFFSLFAIYTNESPWFIAYKWLHYSYSIVLLVVLIIGLLLTLFHKEITLWLLIGYCLLRELLFWTTDTNSCFSTGSYEIYLTLFTGITLAKIVQYNSFNNVLFEPVHTNISF